LKAKAMHAYQPQHKCQHALLLTERHEQLREKPQVASDPTKRETETLKVGAKEIGIEGRAPLGEETGHGNAATTR